MSVDSWAGSASLGSLVYVVLLILVLRGISVHIFFTSCFSGSSCTDWIAKVCPSWQPVSQLCLLMGGANTLTKKVCA